MKKNIRQSIYSKKMIFSALAVLLVLLLVILAILSAFKDRASEEQGGDVSDKNYQEAVTGETKEGSLSYEERKELYEKSAKELEGVVAKDPKNIDAVLRLSSSYYNIGESEKAIAMLEDAVDLDSQNYLVYNNLANLLSEKGDLDGAEKNYRKSIELNPSQDVSYINLAILLVDFKDDIAGARVLLKEGQASNPDSEGIKMLLDQYSR